MIRCALHPQLRELWRTHPALVLPRHYVDPVPGKPSDEDGRLLSSVGGHFFASLVHSRLKVYCELEVSMLRPQSPGAVVDQSGDIDNQLKTLFDALRSPADEGEIPRGWSPGSDEQPLHCLLDDDRLVTKVTVETDRLLRPASDPKEVDLRLRVLVKGSVVTYENIGLIG